MKNSIIFAGYRSWAIDVFNSLKKTNPNINFYLCQNQDQLIDLINLDSCIFVVLAGWSWIIPKKIINKKAFFGLHPSDLPEYSGGSPIQNQIINGIDETKMTLFKISPEIDKGDIVYKTSMSLKGDIDDIFGELSRASVLLLNDLINNYPNIPIIRQEHLRKNFRRIKPEQSNLTKESFLNKSSLQLYNEIRCRTGPYPNVYIEDETGRIYFEKVRFEKNEK